MSSAGMSATSESGSTGWRILGFGRHPEIAAAVQEKLRSRGQDAVNFPATEETTVWFNRILNIIQASASRSKIILVRGPEDAVSAIERVLGISSVSLRHGT